MKDLVREQADMGALIRKPVSVHAENVTVELVEVR